MKLPQTTMASPQFSRKFHVGEAILAFAVLGLLSSTAVECRGVKPHRSNQVSDHQAINCRKHSFDLSKFGGKGDGVTLNTAAFKTAIAEAGKVAADGGALLIVPPGKWLTGSFNLTSHFTLYIHKEAVILASQEERDYQLIAPLPSYGVGRDAPGPRFSSLIMGTNLTDVVITGGNGTIDGQGEPWWTKFKAGQLNNTRPYLIEILYSDQVQISNITLTNSPSWHVHPTYSSNVIIEGVTILAPVFVPNTDGINPDSCTNVRIQNCFIVSGDDCIAVKSGWDQYGIRFAKPMQHLVVRKLTCISPKSAVIALGSEMSGGIEDVRIEDITAISSESGIRIKTAPGRGGYVRDIYARRLTMQTMKYVFWMTGAYGSHPDAGWNPKANPVIQSINYRDVVATNVTMAGQLAGMEGNPFTGICMQNVSIHLTEVPKKVQWNCTDIQGTSSAISPMACGLLEEKKGNECAFPKEPLPIEGVVLKTCPTSFA